MKLCIHILGIACLIALSVACRSTKKIQKAIERKDTVAVVALPTHEDTMRVVNEILGHLKKGEIRFTTFSAKIKVDYSNAKGKQPDFVAHVRMLKDSLIWISLGNDIGIEGMRVLITRDSIKLMDKLANTYQKRKLSSLQEISQIPFTLSDLQNLIVGNPIFIQMDSINAYTRYPTGYTLPYNGSWFRNQLTVTNDFLLERSKLDDKDLLANRTADIQYKLYENRLGFLFSSLREISLSQQNRLDVQLRFKDYHFNEEMNFPFTIPKKFKRID